MWIKINKEIKEYNETMFFVLSVRQLIFALFACVAAVGIYFGCRPYFDTETLSLLCMIGAAPFAALFSKLGSHFEAVSTEEKLRVIFDFFHY